MTSIYWKSFFRLIWGFSVGYSFFNCEYEISIPVFLLPLIAVLIYNFILYRDFNIFKNDLDRSIEFLETYLKEIKLNKINNSNE